MALQPLNDFVLIEEQEQAKTTASGIILDYAKLVGDINIFTVLNVGENVDNVSEGDSVVIVIPKAYSLSYQGKKLYLVKEEDILAVEQ